MRSARRARITFTSRGRSRLRAGAVVLSALSGEGVDGSSFNGLAELGAVLRKQPIMGPCLVSKLYAEALGRPGGPGVPLDVEAPPEAPCKGGSGSGRIAAVPWRPRTHQRRRT